MQQLPNNAEDLINKPIDKNRNIKAYKTRPARQKKNSFCIQKRYQKPQKDVLIKQNINFKAFCLQAQHRIYINVTSKNSFI